jgi:putative ABC transport system permease protein
MMDNWCRGTALERAKLKTPTLYRASFAYLWRHPWQFVLALLGICIGVAVMVAVDLANDSARKAFLLSMSTINGQATHQIVGGPAGLEEDLYTTLRVEHEVRSIAPVIDGYIEYEGTVLHLLGVDLFAEQKFRAYNVNLGQQDHKGSLNDIFRRILTEPGSVLLPDKTASRLGLQVDQAFSITAAGKRFGAVPVALISGDGRALDNLIIADIAVAQEWLALGHTLSHIDVVIPKDDDGRLEATIRAALPVDAQMLEARGRSRSVAAMSNAFMTNLTAMSLLALLVGIFLIYNSVSFAVLQRRGLIGVLRALGLTRRETFRLVIVEAATLGIIGAILGVALGTWLGDGLLTLVSRSINDLYFRITVTDIFVSPWSISKGLLAGLGATLLAAAVPATEAASYRPQLAIARSVLEHRTRRLLPLLTVTGITAVALAIVLLKTSGTSLVAGLVALFLLILGIAVCIPLFVKIIARWLAPIAARVGGTPARLATSGISTSISRTGVAIVALSVAVSATIGVTVMIDSFRSAVSDWIGNSLQSDIYIAAPGGSLDPELIRDLARVSGVADYSTRRWAWLESPEGRTRIIASKIATGRYAGTTILDADEEDAWQQFNNENAVFISEPFAYKNRLASGDTLELLTRTGKRSFPVAATYQSYDAGSGSVLMSRNTYIKYWDDYRIDALGIYLEQDADIDKVMADLNRASSNKQAILVRSNRTLTNTSLQIFDRTFVITNVLRWLAVGVAVIGILGAMLALQLERSRELAVLRALGMTPGQLGGMVTLQTGLMGLLSGLAAIPLGLIMAWILIDVINRRSFGWSMDIQTSPEVLLVALALSVGTALIAGLYPAYRAARSQPALAMREE